MWTGRSARPLWARSLPQTLIFKNLFRLSGSTSPKKTQRPVLNTSPVRCVDEKNNLARYLCQHPLSADRRAQASVDDRVSDRNRTGDLQGHNLAL